MLLRRQARCFRGSCLQGKPGTRNRTNTFLLSVSIQERGQQIMEKGELQVPQFSMEERERRYRNIRDAMTVRGLDCLIIHGDSSKWDSNTADIRYLSQIGGNGEEGYMLFPLQGEPVCWIWINYMIDWWKRAQAWVSDVRVGMPSWSDCVIQEIHDRDLSKSRIGIVGMGGMKDPEGKIPYHFLSEVNRRLHEAEILNATDILENARLSKSEEEIGFLTKAAELGDESIKVMLEKAKPGVKDNEVLAEMIYSMLKNGGEMPPMVIWEAAKYPRHASRHPTTRILEEGDIIVNEISPKYGGYFAHPHYPVAVGGTCEKEYVEMFEICLEAFNLALETLRPGITIGEFAAKIDLMVEERGYLQIHPLVHGLGLGHPEFPMAPIAGQPKRKSQSELLIRENMVFALEPVVATPDASKALPLGDTVVVTKEGCRQLGSFEFVFPQVNV